MTSSQDVLRRTPFCSLKSLGASALVLVLLGGCDENGQFSLPLPQAVAPASTAGTTPSTKLIERDVEAPEIFSANDEGLWDGRPSLGGVWVAHPDVSDPERVIVRNEDNGKFVVGALFRKERDLPGPKLQVSSDAAAALGILAGAPAKLNVTALRREETEEIIEEEPAPEVLEDEPAPETVANVAAPAEVASAPLDPIAAASAAIEAAPPTPPLSAALPAANATTVAATPEPAPPAPKPAAPRKTSSLDKPFIQLGIFSVEANANRVTQQMSNAGIVATVKTFEANGRSFWRVVVGPATSRSELRTLTAAIKAEGFSDAYAVTN